MCFLVNTNKLITASSSPKITAASRLAKKRIECMSQKEQDELKDFAWFQAGIPREISLELLMRKNPGEFLVRESTTKLGCFALSLRVPPPGPKVAHYLIVKTSRGYKIKVSPRIIIKITVCSINLFMNRIKCIPFLFYFFFCFEGFQ